MITAGVSRTIVTKLFSTIRLEKIKSSVLPFYVVFCIVFHLDLFGGRRRRTVVNIDAL